MISSSHFRFAESLKRGNLMNTPVLTQVDQSRNHPDVFLSYASRDRERLKPIVRGLESRGITVWRDQERIDGGESYGPRIVDGIKNCKVLLLACSEASLRSRNVRQEIQIAWSYERPCLPILLESMTAYPEPVRYWLEGNQWIEVLDRPPEEWLPRVLISLDASGVSGRHPDRPVQSDVAQNALNRGLVSLRAVARYNDQIWPIPADRISDRQDQPRFRDLGAPQDDVAHGYRLGSRVCLALESDRDGHLLLLDEGTSGRIYCLCPSQFAPDMRIRAGRTYFPQHASRYRHFEVSGSPGREHLLALISEDPLMPEWISTSSFAPARRLEPTDVETLLTRLRHLPADRWVALAKWFDVLE